MHSPWENKCDHICGANVFGRDSFVCTKTQHALKKSMKKAKTWINKGNAETKQQQEAKEKGQGPEQKSKRKKKVRRPRCHKHKGPYPIWEKERWMMEAKWNATLGNGKEPASGKQVTWIAGDVLEWLCPRALCIQASSSRVDNISSLAHTHKHKHTWRQCTHHCRATCVRNLNVFCAGDKQARTSSNQISSPAFFFCLRWIFECTQR